MPEQVTGPVQGVPLHLIWLVDCSGSMQIEGRLPAVNGAIRDALEHCRHSVVVREGRARVLVQALAFSSGYRWHLAEPVPLENLRWPDLGRAEGYTDLGAALQGVAQGLQRLPSEPPGLPPVLVLITDGEPTDDYEPALRALLREPSGARTRRFAVGVGPDADLRVLQQFLGESGTAPFAVTHPGELSAVLHRICDTALQAVAGPVGNGGGRTPVRTARAVAIDFGTTFTSAAVRDAAGRVTTIAFDNGETRFPSGVLRQPDGSMLVGAMAEARAAMNPQAFEPTPKRLVGHDTVLLGGEEVAVVDLISAVLGHAAAEVGRQQGADLRVVLTHPADWRGARLKVLVSAAERAGLREVVLLPEPVAAAASYTTGDDVEPGAVAAVYDLGGGTFDAAVVERTPAGWTLAGRPAGIDPLGGVDFDRLLLDHLGEAIADLDPEAWAKLDDPPDMSWRRRRRELQREVRAAKEALSSHPSWTVFVPGAEETVTVTAEELERLIGPLVDRSVELMVATIAEAGRRPDDLRAVYLTGGSSRIPLVHRRLWDALGAEPRTRADPKLVVVTGALSGVLPGA